MQKKRSYNASFFLWKKDGKGHARWPQYYMVRCSFSGLAPNAKQKQGCIIRNIFFVFVYLLTISVIPITTFYKIKKYNKK